MQGALPKSYEHSKKVFFQVFYSVMNRKVLNVVQQSTEATNLQFRSIKIC